MNTQPKLTRYNWEAKKWEKIPAMFTPVTKGGRFSHSKTLLQKGEYLLAGATLFAALLSVCFLIANIITHIKTFL